MSEPETREVACQTEPNLIDKLINPGGVSNGCPGGGLGADKQRTEDKHLDLYQEYVRSAQCAQFWHLDKNPIRSLVPSLIKVDLPEQHLKNESLMFALVQTISNNTKLVNLLAKYIHNIVPNVIISKRVDLIPLITCTIRVCRDPAEQERLLSLLFNLIKRPNEEQRRMILAGIIVVLQVSPSQNSQILPNLCDYVTDKFPERRILLADACASLAHYVRPALRTKLILRILIELLKDKNAAVKSAACKSFACTLTLIMDHNDEVFDSCLKATEELIQDLLQQTPMSFCEHRFELDEMRHCSLEAIFPLVCLWSVKLGRFKQDVALTHLAKAEKYLSSLTGSAALGNITTTSSNGQSSKHQLPLEPKILAAVEVDRRRSMFFQSKHKRQTTSSDSGLSTSSGTPPLPEPSSTGSSLASSLFNAGRRQSAFVTALSGRLGGAGASSLGLLTNSGLDSSSTASVQRAISAHFKMVTYLVPFVFADSVHSCAWLSKSSSMTTNETSSQTNVIGTGMGSSKDQTDSTSLNEDSPTKSASHHQLLFEGPLMLANKLLDPSLVLEDSAIIAYHEQMDSTHLLESLDWMLDKFLPRFLQILALLTNRRFQLALGWTSPTTSTTNSNNNTQTSTGGSSVNHNNAANLSSVAGSSSSSMVELLSSCIASIRNLCLLFGRRLTNGRIRSRIKEALGTLGSNNQSNNGSSNQNDSQHQACNPIALYTIQMASLTAFEPIEQAEFELLVNSLSGALWSRNASRCDMEILGSAISIIGGTTSHIQSPSGRQKFLSYTLDAIVSYAIKATTDQNNNNNNTSNSNQKNQSHNNQNQNYQNNCNNNQPNATTKAKENVLILFRHILTCLIEPTSRPTDWAHILVSKFLPTLISLANDPSDVYTCTYARLMCAKLVETFDLYFSDPKRSQAEVSLPDLESLRALTKQILASNLRRQIECLIERISQ